MSVKEINLQQKALQVFREIQAAAEKWRTESERAVYTDTLRSFDHVEGICYQIDLAVRDHLHDKIVNVKENLIRTLPSYSGAYHHPVPCPNGGSASAAWNNTTRKWEGPYGDCRMQQLQELIEAIETRWEDSLTERRSPAARIGMQVGTVVRHKGSGKLLQLHRDDDSSNPGFGEIGNPKDYHWVDLSEVEKVDVTELYGDTSFEGLMATAKDKVAARAALQEQRDALNALIATLDGELGLVDVVLATKYEVRRIAA